MCTPIIQTGLCTPRSGLTARQACGKQVSLLLRRHCFRNPSLASRPSKTIALSASDKDDSAADTDSPESLFRKELKRRGLSSGDHDQDDRPSTSTSTRQSAEQRPESSEQKVPPPPRDANQLKKSRALGSEGIEGLVPRLAELGKLGLTFFLAFGPLILVTAALFGGLYLLFGDEFVHGGRTFTSIPYVDPQDLLDEPSIDPTVPFR